MQGIFENQDLMEKWGDTIKHAFLAQRINVIIDSEPCVVPRDVTVPVPKSHIEQLKRKLQYDYARFEPITIKE